MTIVSAMLMTAFFVVGCEPDDPHGSDTPTPDDPTVNAPFVRTDESGEVGNTWVTWGGEFVEGQGYSMRDCGFCWATHPDPSVDDNYVKVNYESTRWTLHMSWLKPGTTYYLRACIISWGEQAYYGEQRMVTTATGVTANEEVFTFDDMTFKMLRVEGGGFSMGATAEQGADAQDDECPAHSVTVDSYYIGETEVTQKLWETVMGVNHSYNKGLYRPVESVYYADCYAFIDAMNSRYASQLNGRRFDLPTEAEWEYAARGGQLSQHYKYSGSNTLADVAWYDDDIVPKPVAQKLPNELGIYDMSGNVWEWCSDWYDYDYYKESPSHNPQGPSHGDYRVTRGGSARTLEQYCRVSCRENLYYQYSEPFTGLRLVIR